MDIAIDFDGTVVKHMYPIVGDDVPNAVNVMKKIIESGNNIILNTMRSGKPLEDAVNWFKSKEIPLYGINHNPNQTWTTSPKVYAQIYIDDAALGCPLIFEKDDRPYVDWNSVEKILIKMRVI